jgi:small-conductance mechanosensitive channel
MTNSSRAAESERRIALLTLLFGGVTATGTVLWHSAPAAAGVAVGAILAWVNLRWMQGGLNAMTALSTAQAGAERPRISRWVYAKYFLRYVLIGVVIYVMLSRFGVPVVSVLTGLLMLGAATLAQSVFEVFSRPK